jgi:exodeoxyribonuclease-3
VKIATYNVNGISARLPLLLEWLRTSQPDIACLQELKAPDDKFPESALKDAGYGAVWLGQKSWNGVAILAKGSTPELTRRGLPGEPDPGQSRYIEAKVNGLDCGCLYLPNGNPAPGPKFTHKLEWLEAFIRYAGSLITRSAPVVLAGDYNIMPTELDVYKPERWTDDALFRPEVRDAFRRLIEQGWTDSVRSSHPNEIVYTFWDYFRNAFSRNAGLRIDHLLLSPALTPRLVTANIDRDIRAKVKTSDHAPVWVELCDPVLH